MRRFIAVVIGATMISMVLGYVIAVDYALNLNIELAPRPPFSEPSRVEQDATAGLEITPSSPNG